MRTRGARGLRGRRAELVDVRRAAAYLRPVLKVGRPGLVVLARSGADEPEALFGGALPGQRLVDDDRGPAVTVAVSDIDRDKIHDVQAAAELVGGALGAVLVNEDDTFVAADLPAASAPVVLLRLVPDDRGPATGRVAGAG